jgi:CO/xanthine dehydrogenase FAD-binding subunit
MLNPHPGLPEFDYVKPASLEEASHFLASHPGEARPFSGGTDCFVRMRDGFMQPKFMVDIKGLEENEGTHFSSRKGPYHRRGCMHEPGCSHARSHQLLSIFSWKRSGLLPAISCGHGLQLIGNICNSSPAGDTIGACLVLEGQLNVHGVHGDRVEPLKTFFRGPGKNVLEPGDIVTSITLPIPP